MSTKVAFILGRMTELLRRRLNSPNTIGLLSITVAVYGCVVLGDSAMGQIASSPAQSAAGTRTIQGNSQRGEATYYIKCNFCHAEIAKWAPTLRNLYRRPKLVSGKPVSDETVAEQIRNGSKGMPSFRYTLSDTDIADLVSYLREGKCCPDPENPPANPKYRGR